MLGSRAWRALMRRNLIYRKRNIIGTLLELILPIGFICILLAIKLSLEDTESFSPKLEPPFIPENVDAIQPLSFSDYITAIQAERQCTSRRGFSFLGGGSSNKYVITGMQNEGKNWFVPFVKCDSRACNDIGEDARSQYCEYQILAVAPSTAKDSVGLAHVQSFKTYIENRYPEVLTERVTELYATSRFGATFVVEFDDNQAIEEYIKSQDYGKSGNPKVGLAVIFSAGTSDTDYKYSLRMNSTNFNNPEGQARPAAKTTPTTDSLFSTFAREDDVCQLDGTDMGIYENSCTGQYMYNGALVLQRLVGDWIMQDSGAVDNGYYVSEHGVQFVPFPSPEYTKDGFYDAISQAVPLLVIIGMLYPVSVMIRSVTSEKEFRQKELMKMMSVTESDIGWSWFISYFAFHIITIIGCVASSAVLYSSSSATYLIIFWIFAWLCTIVFCLAVASFMSKATRATLVGLLLFFVGYFLTIALDFQTASSGLLALCSLHPAAAFSFGLQEIGRLEDLGVGVISSTWNTTDNPSGYTFQRSINSMLFCSALWGIVSWYLNRVVPSDFGTPLKWYFPFTGSYWCPGSAHAPEESSGNEQDGEIANDAAIPVEPVSDAMHHQAEEGKSIEIHNLVKQFGEKTAVDGLTLSMYNGQVTALLGHNGAGKTTTINMLTGMIAPTAGYAVVGGKDIRTQMNQIREDIGICLQHDCLFPTLTVKEHVQFFARVKGLYAKCSKEDAEKKIMESIEDVALAEKQDTFSKNLSGGMKRKLSVAIAFCGDSKTVLLDEPTSGMDPFSRRFTWNVIRRYREDRCIILTTHFMDEADILGDRIAIMAEGQLRCAGSSLFLKKLYGVGYQLTIEKKYETHHKNGAHNNAALKNDDEIEYHADEEYQAAEKITVDTGIPAESADDHLRQIVKGAVPKAHQLSNVGTEMTFQLPLGASSDFQPMFEALDKEVGKGTIVTYGVSITTLDEVFLMVARGETSMEHEALPSSSIRGPGAVHTDLDKSTRSKTDLQNQGLFARHVRALFQKRALNFKRDKKAWVCSTILPSIFVFIGLLIYKFAPLSTGDYDALLLTLEDYNKDVSIQPRNPIPFNSPGTFSCHPGTCAGKAVPNGLNITGETYSYCGAGFLDGNSSCSIDDSVQNIDGITVAGADPKETVASNMTEASASLLKTSFSYAATQYGALFYTHEVASTTNDGSTYGESVIAACQGIDRDYVTEETHCATYGGIGYVVSYNYTALHGSPLYQSLADESLIRQAIGDDEFTITPTFHPMPITAKEENYGKAADSFVAWFLIVLSFPFIAASFGTFVVAERASKAKHLQTVAGVKPISYWISTYLWDVMNYQLPLWITVILMFAFGIETFTTSERGVVGGTILLLFLFGPAAAAFTYCMSFAFKSPSMCSLFVIIFNFIISMAGPIVMLVLRIIGSDPADPNESLVNIAEAIEWVLRFVPSFCLGKGLYNAINIELFTFLEGEGDITVWHESILLWEVVFLAWESVVYLLLAIQIDIWSANPKAVSRWNAFVRFITCRCCCPKGADDRQIQGAIPDDEDVLAEQERVLKGEAGDDLIFVDKLTKQYPNGKIAVNNVSFGIPPGQCFGLLGINGAGKTTIMGVLTAEFPPTTGDATLAGFSVTRQPEMTRRRIGYCPQFDAHFTNMTGREHVEMYASIKGVPAENVKEAAAAKLDEFGLDESDRERLSAGYSGGMKRKLSVACATIGQPQIVFLDEPSTGMDPVARRDLWKVISDMVDGGNVPEEERTSVILTTHSMEECEALCPRIAIMANGKLRCLGSAQHLKTRFGQGYQVELKLKIVDQADEDYKINLLKLQDGGNTASQSDEYDADAAAASVEEGIMEGSIREAEDKFLTLNEALQALQGLTGDDYLSSMVRANSPTVYVVHKAATSATGVTLNELATFATDELRMRSLQAFVELTYPNSILRERQDGKARYEVSSEGVRISNIFANIEENKDRLMLADYGVSQTTLEQVFNMHAAEAEKLKHGHVDHEGGGLGAMQFDS